MEPEKNTILPAQNAAEKRVGRDLMLLIDEFEQFLHERSRVPLTGKILCDEEDLYGFLDHLRQTVPSEIRRAMELLNERDRILERAEAEAESIVAEARQYGDRLTQESTVTRRAEEEAAKMLERAREESRNMRQEADAYADGILQQLEEVLGQAYQKVRQGREYLRRSQGRAAELSASQRQEEKEGGGSAGS